VVSGERTLSYGELAATTARLSAALRRAGVGPGVQVALALPNSVSFITWLFGVLEAGGVAAMLSPLATVAEVRAIRTSGGISLLATESGSALAEGDGMRPAPEVDVPRGTVLARALDRSGAPATTPRPAADAVFRWFSSGTTGRPKHVVMSGANVAFTVPAVCRRLGLDAREIFLACAPFHHGWGLRSILGAFHLAGTVVVLPRFLPAPVLEAAARHRVTVFLATPPMIGVLGDCAIPPGLETPLRSLRVCVCAGARLPQSVHAAFRRRFGLSVGTLYGATESPGAAVHTGDDYQEGRVGAPLPGVEIGIFDEHGVRCGAGLAGEIGIRSPATCDGYAGDPESTARAFRRGWFFPGDRGHVDADGVLFVHGRSDVINVGGYKVDPLEVEAVIRQSLPVTEVVVLEARRDGRALVRAVVEADPAEVTRARVLAACRERLTPHKVPALVEIRARLERDANGKVIRARLDARAPGER
jgi:long-chain acyl-CoA synthetase